jgi:cytochrome c peroxidase
VDLLKRNEFRANSRFSDDRESTAALLSDAVVNSPENWGRFRTPSLRGVGRTAPYMHAGHFETLEEVVRFYSTLEGAVQLDHHQETVLEPLLLSEEEIRDLVAFLGTLSAAGPRDDLMEPPAGPRSGARPPRATPLDRRVEAEAARRRGFTVSQRPSDG